jgi:hypothetical protein
MKKIKIPLYTIRETWSTYTKKKGAFEKTKFLHRKISQTLLNELLVTDFKDLNFKQVDENNQVATTKGLLYPGRISITKSYKTE